MKKFLAILLAFAMLLSLAACGGKETPEESSTTTPESAPTETEPSEAPEESTPEVTEPAEGEVKTVITQYGADPNYEVYTATINCPDGAYFDEDEYAEFLTDGYINDFWIYDDVREYSAFSTVYWSRDIYKEGDELPLGYGIVEQLYFEGEVAPETAAEYPEYDQKVTDLGFKWNDQEVKLIETTYTSADDFTYNEVFIGAEYTHYFWVADGETGEVTDGVTAPGLFGFSVSGWDLTVDQYAWIAGQLFGVDSGRTWVLESDGEVETPAASVDSAALVGTWLQRDSDWEDTYIFNADGTGMLISGPEYPFAYSVSGDTLTLVYAPDDIADYTVSVDGDVMTLVDQFGNELVHDRQVEEEETSSEEPSEEPEESEPEYWRAKEIIGTWTDEAGGYEETFVFNADGTGTYSYVDGEKFEMTFTYKFLDDYTVEMTYSDGTVGYNEVDIVNDRLLITNDVLFGYPFDRQ